MLAVYASGIDRDDPLSVLTVGELPEPETPEDWVTVHVRAASLNHHDVWALKGQALKADQVPMILGTDAAGRDRRRPRGGDPRGPRRPGRRRRRRDPRSPADAAQRALPGRPGRAGARARPQPRRQAGRAHVRGGGLPADRLPDRVPHDRVEVRHGAGRHDPRPGRGRGRVDGADRARQGPRPSGVGDLAGRGEARVGARSRGRCGVRVGCAAARQGRCGHGDRRRGDVGPLPAVPAPGRPRRHLGRHVGTQPAGRPQPGVLPAAEHRRLDHGHDRGVPRAHRPDGAHGPASGHRPHPARWSARRRRSPC